MDVCGVVLDQTGDEDVNRDFLRKHPLPFRCPFFLRGCRFVGDRFDRQVVAPLGLVLKNAIAALPVRQRKLLQLRFYEHLAFEAIAESTSLSVRTIYNKLHEAIKKLRSNSSIKKLR